MVKINFEKKDLWLIAAICVLLVGVGVVVAYNANWDTSPGNPAVHGHSVDEVVIPVMNNPDTTNMVAGTMWIDPTP